MEELANICHCQHGSDLEAYRDRGFWLRRRIERMGMPVPDQMYMGFLVKGLRTYDPDWVDSLYRGIERGSLDPVRLDIAIRSRYDSDKQEREDHENRLKNEHRELAAQVKSQPRNNKRRRRSAKNHHSGQHNGVVKRCSARH